MVIFYIIGTALGISLYYVLKNRLFQDSAGQLSRAWVEEYHRRHR